MSRHIAPPSWRRFVAVLCVAGALSSESAAALAKTRPHAPHFVKYFPADTDGQYESFALVRSGDQFWFTANGAPDPNVIGSFKVSHGVVSNVTLHYVNGNPASGMENLVVASDGTVWATVGVGVAQTIMRLSKTGGSTYFPVPGLNGDGVGALVPGPHGSMWFTTEFQGNIGSFTPSGSMHLVLAGGQTQGICAGPNGSAWFTSGAPPVVGFVTASDGLTRYPIPTTASNATPGPIVAGPDGNYWFTDIESTGSVEQDYIVEITPTGTITKYPTPTGAANLADIVLGADGNLWATERNAGQLVRTTPTGTMTEFPLPHDPDGGADAWSIVRGGAPSKSLWFLNNSGYVGRFDLE
jgi:streptogramin lyase